MRGFRKILSMSLLEAMLVVAGCATSYQPKSFTGGYQDFRIGPNVFRVRFEGNGYTSKERVTEFFYRRCAEVARANGFDYFILEAANSDDQVNHIRWSNGQSSTSGTVTANQFGGTYQQTTTYQPPVVSTVHRYTVDALVVGMTAEDAPANALGSREILGLPSVPRRSDPAKVTQPTAQGCTKDTDCKGERICSGGMCAEPNAGASAE